MPDWVELAHFEWLELVLDIAEPDPVPDECRANGDSMAGLPVFAPVLAMVRYRHPVHRFQKESQGAGGFPQLANGPFHILGFRDADDAVRFVEISAATARLVERIRAGGITGHEGISALAARLNAGDLESLMAFGSQILRDLRAQSAILGTRSLDPTTSARESIS